MIHKVVQGGDLIEVEIDHNRIKLWHKDKNITQYNPEPPAPFIGCYSEQSEAWVLPSPIDAMSLLKKLPALLTSGFKLALEPSPSVA